MPVRIFTEGVTNPYSDQEIDVINRWIESSVEHEGQSGCEVNIILCSDDFLLDLNRRFLNHDYYTDVLTFPHERDPMEGEIYISTERVEENARERSISVHSELHRVIIHGILHLLGYDDQYREGKNTMTAKEDYYLSRRPQEMISD